MSTPPPPFTLDALNAMSAKEFIAALGDVFEHAPWVAEAAAQKRPFATVAELHAAMSRAVTQRSSDEQLAFIRLHPELGSKVARADLTDASKSEQGGLGLDQLSDAEFAKFERLNSDYVKRFGFPFIICVRRHTRNSILATFERRLTNSAEAERAAALAEIGLITRLRLVGKVDGPGKPKAEGRLSTHVLDTVTGQPAADVKVVLTEIGASARGIIHETMTNGDGRTDRPLMGGGPLRIGTYEIAFHMGAYFHRQGTPTADPAFLDIVPLRFAIAEPEAHYHVPLLVSPWSYSTYRGS